MPPRHPLRAVWVAVGAVVFIATLAFFVTADNALTQADAQIVRWASTWRTPFVGDIASAVSLLGNVLVLGALAIAASIASAVRHGRHRFTALPVLALAAAATFDPLAKLAVGRPRPPAALAEVIETASGYPSGHSAQATAFWLAMAFLFTASATRPRPWVIAGAAMAILVGLSRIVLGVHSPTDVLAGLALGLACVLMTRELLLLPRPSDARPELDDERSGPGTRKASREQGLTLSSAPSRNPLSGNLPLAGICSVWSTCFIASDRRSICLSVQTPSRVAPPARARSGRIHLPPGGTERHEPKASRSCCCLTPEGSKPRFKRTSMAASPHQQANTWSLEDFVLNGTYCPDSIVHDVLRSLSETVGLPHRLIVTSKWSVLQSFSASQGLDQRSDPWPPSAGLANSHRKHVRRRIAVAEAAGRHILSSPPPDALRMATTSHTEVTARALTTQDLDFLLFASADVACEAFDSELKRVAMHVLSSLRSDVHRDVRRSYPIDQLLRDVDRDFAPGVQKRLLELVMDATGSQGVVLHVRELGSDDFLRTAEAGESIPGPQRVSLVHLPADGSTNPVIEVATKRRACQASLTLADESEGICLAMAVPGASASFDGRPAGVLSIVKRVKRPDDRDTVIRADDYKYLRNAALRIAILTSHSMTFPIAEQTGPERATIGPTARSDVRLELTRDVEDALPLIERSLRECVELTGCDSATFRVLLPEAGFPSGNEFALVRACAVPSGRMNDNFSRIALDHPASNTIRAIRTGNKQYVADSWKTPSRVIPVRDSSRTHLSIPVRVEGRVIGAVNLESAQPNYFVATAVPAEGIPTATALAIGAHVSDSRMSLARAQQSMLYPLLALRHEAPRDAAALLAHLDEVTSATSESALEAARLLARKLDVAFGEQITTDDRPAPRDLVELIGWAIDRAGAKRDQWRLIDESRGATGFLSRGSNAQIVGAALYDIARNFVEHADTPADREVRVGSLHLGGVDYDSVLFSNRASVRPDPDQCLNAYLAPLVASTVPRNRHLTLAFAAAPGNRMQLGTFLAGSSLRAVGGHAAMTVRGAKVHTIVTLPRSVDNDT